MNESDLVAAIAEGDVGALRVLHDARAPWLASRLRRRCSDVTVVDEVVQDTFLAVWRHAAQFRGDGEVSAWRWGIAIRKLIDRLRRKRLPFVELSGRVQSAEEAVLEGVGFGELAPALEALSPELLAVVQVTILDGLTAREAGRLLGNCALADYAGWIPEWAEMVEAVLGAVPEQVASESLSLRQYPKRLLDQGQAFTLDYEPGLPTGLWWSRGPGGEQQADAYPFGMALGGVAPV